MTRGAPHVTSLRAWLHPHPWVLTVTQKKNQIVLLKSKLLSHPGSPTPIRNVDGMCCSLVLDTVTSTPQWTRKPRPRVYLEKSTYHTRLFIIRGPGQVFSRFASPPPESEPRHLPHIIDFLNKYMMIIMVYVSFRNM